MSGRSLRLRFLVAVCVATGVSLLQAQIPGRNVNMVSGDKWPGGDPYLQRQNEPSLAASTRNPLHLLAGSNDYRTVDLPGLEESGEIGDAWLGLYKSFDGGQRWQSTLLPGYPQDTSAIGKSSPIYGYEAAADPVVRPGSNGLFYFSGIVFDRGAGGKSRVFVSRFIDNNNKEAGDPIHYLGTTAVGSNPGTAFIDKPWLAVDVPRAGAKTCAIDTPGSKGGRLTQRLPAGNVYVTYSVIVGTEPNITSTIMFSRSIDCGVTWTAPVAISDPADKVNQGSTMAIDPATGAVHVAWRKFGLGMTNDAIVTTKLTVGGKADKFDKPKVLREFYAGRELGQLVRFLVGNRLKGGKNKDKKGTIVEPPLPVDPAIAPFDQVTLADRFRTNAYPTIAIDGNSRVYLAWSERGFRTQTGSNANTWDASIVMSTGLGGTWTPAFAVEMHSNPGHQVMPSLAFAGGKLMLVYYDLREDISAVFGEGIAEAEAAGAGKRHTIDLRATQADPAAVPSFSASVRVSEYLEGSRKGSKVVEQLQFNPPNLPLFQLGEVPFMGDYVDIAAAPAMVQDATGVWRFNTAGTTTPVFHTAWTDNRDVKPPPAGKTWKDYTPPGGTRISSTFDPTKDAVPCSPGSAGMRNQNVYTSRITAGLLAGSPGNSKPLSTNTPRAFVVFAQNTTSVRKWFRMTITNQPVGGRASFTQLADEAIVTAVDVAVPARSTVSKTIFATSSDAHAKVPVDISEIAAAGATLPVPNGLSSVVVLNPDISNPDISNPDISNPDISNPDISNPDISNAEVYNPDISNPDISNPDISNPDISNPDISNPDISNVVILNPDISNPDISNPDISNPDISNPDISNPDISNPDISNGSLTDVTWTVTNKGNTTANYDVNVLEGVQVSSKIKTQIIIHKTYITPVSDGCTLKYMTQTVLVSSIVNPHLATADELNAALSLWLEPGAQGKVTLRIVDPDPTDAVKLNPIETPLQPEIESPAVNTQQLSDPVPEPPIAKPPTIVATALSVVSQPSSALVTQPIGVVQALAIRTTDGVPAPAAGISIVAAIVTNPGGGNLTGATTIVTDANGVATFPSLTIDRPGAGYQLSFTASGVSALPVASAAFNISIPAADPDQNVFVVTTTANAGPGSLRQAILDANAKPAGPGGMDLIAFGFRLPGVQKIVLTSPLPSISQPVIIDGTTQLGFNPADGQPVIEVAGTGANDFQGLVFSGGSENSAVKGLSLTGFGAPTSTDTTAAIRVDAPGIVVQGNWIGIAPNGTAPGNKVGIWITSGSAVIGGTDGLSSRNVISAGQEGIYMSGGAGTTIRGNFIGTSPDGLEARPNTNLGINMQGGVAATVIGGPIVMGGFFATSSPANLISGNVGGGIGLQDAGAGGPAGTQILGNVIGLSISGVDLGNHFGGISIQSASGTVVGSPGAGNVISGNGQVEASHFGPGIGVHIGGSGLPAVAPVIRANLIGVDTSGTIARPNFPEGISLSGPAKIGGSAANEGNLIAGNGDPATGAGAGINLHQNASGTTIEGNTIGLSLAGAALGNGTSGITIGATNGVAIGGPTPGHRNVISGNRRGIQIQPGGAIQATNISIRGNWIGTDLSGNAAGVGNGDWGIFAEGTAITVGGNAAADANVIVGNGFGTAVAGGVAIVGAASEASILSNVIHDNNGPGIDLDADGLTANDPGDDDAGGNRLLNYPILNSAKRSVISSKTLIPLSLESTPGFSYRLQFFTNAACDAGGRGEGAALLFEQTIVPPTASTNTVVQAPLVPAGTIVTATVTGTSGATVITSEFSNCVNASDDPTVLEVTTTANDGPGSLRAALAFANGLPNSAQPDAVTFAITGAGAQTISLSSALPAITDPVVIDGTTQAGYTASTGQPMVQVSGSGLAAGVVGFAFNGGATGSTIRGLSITGFGTPATGPTTPAIRVTATNISIEANWIGIAPDGSAPGNQTGIHITAGSASIGGVQGAATRNVIAAGRTGIFMVASNGTTIRGNYIGTDPTGLLARGHTVAGISVQTPNSINTTIGGPKPAGGYFAADSPANIVSANQFGGIQLLDVMTGGPVNTQILGNIIGLSADGSDLGNNGSGILTRGASGTIIGAPGAGNVISGNGVITPFTPGGGINVNVLAGAPAPAVIPVIQSNIIGLNPTGTSTRPNAYEGILLSTPARVGGSGLGEGNAIAGNGKAPADGTGILVFPNAGGSVIEGNLIGLGPSGTAFGNGYSGITVVGVNGLTIGGPTAGHRNVITGNPQRGIFIQPSGPTHANNVAVIGNWIGTQLSGAPGVGNGNWGIVAQGTNIRIGGLGAGEANVINSNGTGAPQGGGNGGVSVVNAASDVSILSNAIHGNNGPGIDLGSNGDTANDNGDTDAGPNGLQNYPVLTSAKRNASAGNTLIPLSFDSAAGTTYRLQFFTNGVCDSSGRGEGASLLHQELLTPASGSTNMVVQAPLVAVGTVVTATATALLGAGGLTSEFSNCVTANEDPSVFNVTTTQNAGAGSLRSALELANSLPNMSGQPDVITFSIPGGGPQTISLAALLPPIAEAVFIDGTTQPGYTGNAPLVRLTAGLGFPAGGAGLNVQAPGVTIRGLSITSFGSGGQGIWVNGAGTAVITANWIGLTPAGAAAGNHSGILLDSGGSVVGGALGLSTRNVISGNSEGIYVRGGTGNVIRGNYIGTNDAGSLVGVGNVTFGVTVLGGEGHIIGGDTTAQGNLIAGNGMTTGGAGVNVQGQAVRRVDIRSNSITGNIGLGINLGNDLGVLPNHAGTSTGANDHQNYPTLEASTNSSGNGSVTVDLASTLGTYRIQVFRNNACDASGHGEGQTLLLETTIAINSPGSQQAVIATGALTAGQFLSATATDEEGNTSEFSSCVTVTDSTPPPPPEPPPPPPPPPPTTVSVGPVGGGGGSAFTMSCPAGRVATGLRGRAGDDIDRTELWCSPPADLSQSALAGAVGGFGGDDYGATLTCPANSVVTGLHGRAGTVLWGGNVVDTIGVFCTNVTTGLITQSSAVGNAAPAATPFQLVCPAGKQVVGLFGGQGGLLDRIGITCQ